MSEEKTAPEQSARMPQPDTMEDRRRRQLEDEDADDSIHEGQEWSRREAAREAAQPQTWPPAADDIAKPLPDGVLAEAADRRPAGGKVAEFEALIAFPPKLPAPRVLIAAILLSGNWPRFGEQESLGGRVNSAAYRALCVADELIDLDAEDAAGEAMKAAREKKPRNFPP